MAYLTNIQNAIVSIIETMTVSGGYNYNYSSTQQEDLAKVTSWPHCNVFLMPEEVSLDSRDFPGMNAYRNLVYFQIHAYNKLDNESANSQFDIDAVLNNMLEDLKRCIYKNYTLGNLVEGINYKRSTRQNLGNSDDIFMPEYLVFDVEITYSQDGDNPTVCASC